LGTDASNNAGTYTFSPATASIFSGNANGTFDHGRQGIYWVQTPDRLTPVSDGVIAALNYIVGLSGSAAVQYDGSAGGGRLVYFGFPFETITSPTLRSAYMADILRFFSKPARFEAIATLSDK